MPFFKEKKMLNRNAAFKNFFLMCVGAVVGIFSGLMSYLLMLELLAKEPYDTVIAVESAIFLFIAYAGYRFFDRFRSKLYPFHEEGFCITRK